MASYSNYHSSQPTTPGSSRMNLQRDAEEGRISRQPPLATTAIKEKAKLEAKMPKILHVDAPASGEADHHKHLALTKKRMMWKNECVAALAEFCGIFLFLFFSFGIASVAGQSTASQSTSGVSASGATKLDTSQLLYSSLGFGFSLGVNAWCFYRTSGSIFNPAIAWGLFLAGALTWYRLLILIPFQIAASIAAAGCVSLLIPGGISARSVLSSQTSVTEGFFIEMIMTMMLMFTVAMLAVEKHRMRALAPIGIALALFIAELFATPFTSASLNPARTLGPDVIANLYDGTCWIYYVAPFVGSSIAVFIYQTLKWFSYETVVEGQDSDDRQLLIRDSAGRLTGFVEDLAANDVARAVEEVPRAVADISSGVQHVSSVVEGIAEKLEDIPLTQGPNKLVRNSTFLTRTESQTAGIGYFRVDRTSKDQQGVPALDERKAIEKYVASSFDLRSPTEPVNAGGRTRYSW